MKSKIRNFFIKLYSKEWIYFCIVIAPTIIGVIISEFLPVLFVRSINLPSIIGCLISFVIVFFTGNYRSYARDFKTMKTDLTEMESVLATNPISASELIAGLLTGSTFGYAWSRFFEDVIYFEKYGTRFTELLRFMNEKFSELDDSRRILLYKALLSKYQKIGNAPDAVGEWVNLMSSAVSSMKLLMQARRKQLRDEISGPLTLVNYFATPLFKYDVAILDSKEVESNITELMRESKGGVPHEVLAHFWETKDKEMLFRFGRFSHEIRTIPREAVGHPL